MPTLGNEKKITIQFSEDGIEIINSKGTKYIVNKDFWDKVKQRIFDLDSTLRLSGKYYKSPEWSKGNPSTVFAPYLVPLYNHLSNLNETENNSRATFESKYQFVKVGEYFKESNGNIIRKFNEDIALSERLNLVYAFFNGSECLYIGKTIQGFRRPFGYHKKTIMKTVNIGISNMLDKGGKVEILVRKENVTMDMDGMQLNLIEAIEQALISKYKPAWNNFSQK